MTCKAFCISGCYFNFSCSILSLLLRFEFPDWIIFVHNSDSFVRISHLLRFRGFLSILSFPFEAISPPLIFFISNWGMFVLLRYSSHLSFLWVLAGFLSCCRVGWIFRGRSHIRLVECCPTFWIFLWRLRPSSFFLFQLHLYSRFVDFDISRDVVMILAIAFPFSRRTLLTSKVFLMNCQ